MAAISEADLKYKGFTLSPAVNWQRQQKGLALSHKFRTGTLKGNYAIDRQIASLEYNQKPYKVTLTEHPNSFQSMQ